MKYIVGKSINEVVYKSIDALISDGYRAPSRNGDISTIYNAVLTIEHPASRHLNLVGRKNNIFATIAETFWVFGGTNLIDPYLQFYLPHARDYADDGLSWRGGYPERIFNGNQINDVIQQFRNDGIFTRRAVTVIYDANLDTSDNLKKIYGLETTKDRPCNLIMDFFITPDKKLHMNVKSRSGDILWGLGSINIFEWTFYQQLILQGIQDNIDPEVTLGTYNHHVTNMHLYDFNAEQGYAVIENKLKQQLGFINTDKIIFPDYEDTHNFFSKLVQCISFDIEEATTDFSIIRMNLVDLFESANVPMDGNLLWKYAELVGAYTAVKNMWLEKGEKPSSIEVNLDGYSAEFVRSIVNSSFRKFEINV